MSLARFLLRAAGWRLPVSVAASAISGFGGAALVTLINEALISSQEKLTSVGLRFAGVSLVVLVARWVSQEQFVRLSQGTLAELRRRVSAQVIEAPFRDLETRGPSHILNVLTEDVANVADFFVALPELVMQGAVVIGCLAYLAVLSVKVFLVATLIVIAGAAGYHFANLRAIEHLREAREQEDSLLRHFRALFDGAKELKLHARRRRAFADEVLGAGIERVRVQRLAGLRIYTGAASVGTFLFFAMIGVVLFVVGRIVGFERQVMSGYALIFLYMILPMEAVLGALPSIGRVRIALERIHELNGELAKPEAKAARALPAPRSALRTLSIRGIAHTFSREGDDRSFELGPIDLELGSGEIVFIVGGNGSGKTTLAKILVGLYAPEGGEIALDGETVTAETRESYRENFSAIFSDFYLFDSLLGLDVDSLDDKARALLVDLRIDHELVIENGVFSTTRLSAGQRKRLALLVAYLEDRPFYLFDEWAADQDPSYKDVFYRRLLPMLRAKGKTVIVISHDDRYFDAADRCIKLDTGKVTAIVESVETRSSRASSTLGVVNEA